MIKTTKARIHDEDTAWVRVARGQDDNISSVPIQEIKRDIQSRFLIYEKTYSPLEKIYFFEEEEDGTVAYVVGEGGMAHTVKRAGEPAYSIFKFCLKYLHQNEKI